MTERRRLLLSLAALAALYVAVIALGDSRAWSGSDAGGKVATVKTMSERHLGVPDVGYWAARWDPTGRYHPLYNTERIGSHWVQVTSLPFAYAGVPLWRIGGPGALLALPILGSLLAAVAARRLARTLGDRAGWAAFWLVGAASPVSFYSGDFWEHSAAVGLALLAVGLAIEADGWRAGARAGLIFGVAAVLRTEMAVYAVAFGVASLAVASERRRWLAQRGAIVAALIGAALPLVANVVTERLVLGTAAGSSRTAGAATGAGAGVGQRLHDGVLTSVGLFADERAGALLLGALAVGAVLATRRYRGAWVAAVGLYVARGAQGLGFVPGALAVTPAGLLARPTTARSRVIAITAVVAIPMVWLVQWRGQLLAQWGGRYLLVSGALLLVTASLEWRSIAPAVALTVAAAGFGAGWHVNRTRDYAHALAVVNDVPRGTVVVSTIAHLGREAGAFYGDRRWLSAYRSGDVGRAADIARAANAPFIAIVWPDGSRAPTSPAGWDQVSAPTRISLLGTALYEWLLRRAP